MDELDGLVLRRDSPNAPVVVLVRSGPARDATEPWLHELESEILRDELVQRPLRFRRLLAAIRRAPAPWLYLSDGVTAGGWLELALSCHRFVVGSLAGSLGFPDIATGAFPAGGAFERTLQQGQRGASAWKVEPVLTPDLAHRSELCHGVLSLLPWPAAALTHASQIASTLAKQHADQRKNKRIEALVTVELPLVANAERDSLSPWQIQQQARKDRTTEPVRLGILLQQCARHYLSNQYLTWLRSEIGRVECATRASARENPRMIVHVDCDQTLPPGPILAALANAATPVLFSSDAEQLEKALDVIWRRAEKQVGATEAKAL